MGEVKRELTLIPKSEQYIQYMIELIVKLPRIIRHDYDKKLTYENLMKAHLESRKNKSLKRDV